MFTKFIPVFVAVLTVVTFSYAQSQNPDHNDFSPLTDTEQPTVPENSPQTIVRDTIYDTVFDTIMVAPPTEPSNRNSRNSDNGNDGSKLRARRERAVSFKSAGFGPARLISLASQGVDYNFYGGKFWEVNQWALIKALGEVTTDFDNAAMVNAILGANVLPVAGEHSLFLGGDIGLGYARGDGGNAFGFSFGGSLGVLFFRNSNIELLVETKATALLDEINAERPVNYALRVGVLF